MSLNITAELFKNPAYSLNESHVWKRTKFYQKQFGLMSHWGNVSIKSLTKIMITLITITLRETGLDKPNTLDLNLMIYNK